MAETQQRAMPITYAFTQNNTNLNQEMINFDRSSLLKYSAVFLSLLHGLQCSLTINVRI